MLFVAIHETADDTSRHSAGTQQLARFRNKSDIIERFAEPLLLIRALR